MDPHLPPTDDFNPLDFEDFPALIWRAGLDKKCHYFNRTWLEFTGRTREQEEGDGWAEGVHPDDLSACFSTYVEAFDARQPFAMEYRLRHRSGEYRWIKDLGRPRHNRLGEFLGYLGACYDVSQERADQVRLQRLNESKARMFSLIAHDLRGPLGALDKTVGLLADRCFDPSEVPQVLEALRTSAGRTQRFVEDLLVWARTQLDGFTAHPMALALEPLVAEAVEPLADSLWAKQQECRREGLETLRVWADPDLLRATLRNLVSNASKFSPRNTCLEIYGHSNRGLVQLAVADTGVGMPPDALERLGWDETPGTRRGTEGELGSGLGLMICRAFVEAQGGSIGWSHRIGGGTEATITLRAAP